MLDSARVGKEKKHLKSNNKISKLNDQKYDEFFEDLKINSDSNLQSNNNKNSKNLNPKKFNSYEFTFNSKYID